MKRGTQLLSILWIPALAAFHCLRAIVATGDPYSDLSSRELSPNEALDECLVILLYASLLFAILRPERLPLSSRRLLVSTIVALCGVVGHVLIFVTDGPPEGYVPGQFVVVTAMVLAGYLVVVRIRGWVKSSGALGV